MIALKTPNHLGMIKQEAYLLGPVVTQSNDNSWGNLVDFSLIVWGPKRWMYVWEWGGSTKHIHSVNTKRVRIAKFITTTKIFFPVDFESTSRTRWPPWRWMGDGDWAHSECWKETPCWRVSLPQLYTLKSIFFLVLISLNAYPLFPLSPL